MRIRLADRDELKVKDRNWPVSETSSKARAVYGAAPMLGFVTK